METKICSQCNKKLPATSEYFASRYDRKTPQFQSNCRNCQKIYRKIHYKKNKAKYIKKASERRRSIFNWLQEYKSALSCEQCNDSRWWVLEFHHRNPEEKEGNISEIIHTGSFTKLKKEINKCTVLCANCHRDLHHQRKTCRS